MSTDVRDVLQRDLWTPLGVQVIDRSKRLRTPGPSWVDPQGCRHSLVPTAEDLEAFRQRDGLYVKGLTEDHRPIYGQLPSGGADVKTALGTATALTLTITSLASSGTAGRESTAVDFSSGLYLDALLEMRINTPNSATANDKCVYVFAYGSLDGTNYPEDLTGSDAAYTIAGTAGALLMSLVLVAAIPYVQNDDQRFGPWAVAPAFGGLMPPKWGIVVLNYAGQTLAATNNAAQYRGVYATVV